MKRAFAMLLLLTACANEDQTQTSTATETQIDAAKKAPPITKEQAREMIANSPVLGEHEFTFAAVSLPVSGSRLNEVTRNTAKQLADAGWIEFDPTGDLALTDKSRNDKRFVLRENGILDIVPLAKKEMGDVAGNVTIHGDGTASVDFSWKWVPNEVGASLKTGLEAERFAKTQNATATFIWDGTSWSVLKIDAKA